MTSSVNPKPIKTKENAMTTKQHNAGGVQAREPKRSTPDLLREEIEQLAYTFYCECGYEHGHDLEHWVEAERRVLERHQGTRKRDI